MSDRVSFESLELREQLDKAYVLIKDIEEDDYLEYDLNIKGVDYFGVLNVDFDKAVREALMESTRNYISNLYLEEVHGAYGMDLDEFKSFLAPYIEEYHGVGEVEFKEGYEEDDLLNKFITLYGWRKNDYYENRYDIENYDEEDWLGEEWLNKFHKKSDVVKNEIEDMISRYGKEFVLEQLKKVVE